MTGVEFYRNGFGEEKDLFRIIKKRLKGKGDFRFSEIKSSKHVRLRNPGEPAIALYPIRLFVTTQDDNTDGDPNFKEGLVALLNKPEFTPDSIYQVIYLVARESLPIIEEVGNWFPDNANVVVYDKNGLDLESFDVVFEACLDQLNQSIDYIQQNENQLLLELDLPGNVTDEQIPGIISNLVKHLDLAHRARQGNGLRLERLDVVNVLDAIKQEA